ncbi:MAG: C40 family peptidase [Streptosporangiales bacterium]
MKKALAATTVGILGAMGFCTSVATAPAADASAKSRHHKRHHVARKAMNQAGDPYRYGSDGPGSFDCSGLTSFAYRAALGRHIGRTTSSQWNAGRRVWHRRNLAYGDLVFTSGHHVGMYVGHHKMVVSPHSGTHVQVRSLTGRHIDRIRRVLYKH